MTCPKCSNTRVTHLKNITWACPVSNSMGKIHRVTKRFKVLQCDKCKSKWWKDL